MGRLSKEQLEVRRKQELRSAQNKRFNATRYKVAANLPLDWREAVEAVSAEEGYVYNGKVTVGGYIKDLVEQDLRRRGRL